GPPPGNAGPPPPGPAGPPPPGSAGPSSGAAGGPPPPGSAAFTSRYGLVRPRDGRYLAGVCVAIGRATNTDPVLWRVMLAVLGFFGGIGILVYLSAWLIIPGEGDTASPVESMLGRGRSSMSPVTVIVLSIVVAVIFTYIVTDAFTALLLGVAILVGGALLLNRERNGAPGRSHPPGGPPPFGAAPTDGTAPFAVPPYATVPVAVAPHHAMPDAYPAAGLGAVPPGVPPRTAGQHFAGPAGGGTVPAWPGVPPTVAPPVPAPPTPPPGSETTAAVPTSAVPSWGPGAVGAGYPPVPPGGYRPPFAPHGPYGGPPPPPVPPGPPQAAPRPPKRPRERSPLGAVTFSLIFVALGVLAVLDLLGVVSARPSAYFAVALATIGVGLLVGTWFGRARWLIALGLVATAALGVVTVGESWQRVRTYDGNVTWTPADHTELSDRYEHFFGRAVLDLRAVDFDGQDSQVTVSINFGEAIVHLPSDVDVTVISDVRAGEADILGQRTSGVDNRDRRVLDSGVDGSGGGTLTLYVNVKAGHLVVTR
ncbi:PspC domain-containing protein, partial [Micromonospora sp. NPDC000207]|uniref:PspC domain-containing protein n=1 Tax=Micromonospora sp. NPDC000207 TaxID=3154246 RepID=UPI00331E7986